MVWAFSATTTPVVLSGSNPARPAVLAESPYPFVVDGGYERWVTEEW
jgi:hypothetical protein